MGAAEWTGYTNAPTYTSYSTNAALPQPATTTASSYGYDSNAGMTDHHSNFHIPTGLFISINALIFLKFEVTFILT